MCDATSFGWAKLVTASSVDKSLISDVIVVIIDISRVRPHNYSLKSCLRINQESLMSNYNCQCEWG